MTACKVEIWGEEAKDTRSEPKHAFNLLALEGCRLVVSPHFPEDPLGILGRKSLPILKKRVTLGHCALIDIRNTGEGVWKAELPSDHVTIQSSNPEDPLLETHPYRPDKTVVVLPELGSSVELVSADDPSSQTPCHDHPFRHSRLRLTNTKDK